MGFPKSVQVGGTRLSVELLEQPIAEDGDKCDGLYRPPLAQIQIKRGLCREKRFMTLVHEMEHAAIDDAGVDVKLEKLVDSTTATAIEEDFVVATNLLIGALRQLGWLKFPGEK